MHFRDVQETSDLFEQSDEDSKKTRTKTRTYTKTKTRRLEIVDKKSLYTISTN